MEQKDIVTATADGDNFSASWVDASDYHGKGHSQVDEKQMVSVRFPDFLFCDVFSDALEYLFGFCRSAGLKTSRNTALDIQITLELGISRNTVPSERCTVCLWLLQRDADFDRAWTDYDGTV